MLLTVNSWQKCGRNSCQQQLETGRNTFQASCSLEVDSWSLKAAAASGVRVWEQQNTAGWEVLAEISLGKDCVKSCRCTGKGSTHYSQQTPNPVRNPVAGWAFESETLVCFSRRGCVEGKLQPKLDHCPGESGAELGTPTCPLAVPERPRLSRVQTSSCLSSLLCDSC